MQILYLSIEISITSQVIWFMYVLHHFFWTPVFTGKVAILTTESLSENPHSLCATSEIFFSALYAVFKEWVFKISVESGL